MKKLIFVSVILFFTVTTFISAQSNLRFGPTVSLNFATLTGKDVTGNVGSKTGFSIGGFLNYHFAEMFALQPELSFVMKGATATGNGVNSTITGNYIELPVLLKVYVPLAGRSPVKLNGYAGPALAINVAASVETQAGGQTSNTDIKNQTKSVDLGLVFGGGVGFDIGKGVLDLSLRYTLGLTTTDNSGANATVKNGVFAIVAAYAFQ
jgi:hypothetical protein